mmetsp:Transcript_59015/g.165568  ORF Transcript_59015/g.165568 Transcript_59015/m.165568 type:complete len:231 (-) Transcript_59015:367-1059(-)
MSMRIIGTKPIKVLSARDPTRPFQNVAMAGKSRGITDSGFDSLRPSSLAKVCTATTSGMKVKKRPRVTRYPAMSRPFVSMGSAMRSAQRTSRTSGGGETTMISLSSRLNIFRAITLSRRCLNSTKALVELYSCDSLILERSSAMFMFTFFSCSCSAGMALSKGVLARLAMLSSSFAFIDIWDNNSLVSLTMTIFSTTGRPKTSWSKNLRSSTSEVLSAGISSTTTVSDRG